MKYQLFDFQENAVSQLLNKLSIMQDDYSRHNTLSAISLTAPTGAGKTVIASATVEGLFFGNNEFDGDSEATVLWLSDSPSLNDQTLKRFDVSSDMLNATTSMVTVDSSFTQNHEQLQPGIIYFLNRQLLSQNGKLANSIEGNKTFYDIIKNTIEDENTHVYLFIDEAHRGIGKDRTSDRLNKTIYSKLIDGQDGANEPMPIVVGVSATPERFNDAMVNRSNRDMKASVDVPINEVRDSGLIKDTIELRSPKTTTKASKVDLIQACQRLIESTTLWKQYCTKHKIPAVIPLLVVQVEDRISKKSLEGLCHIISQQIPGLDMQKSFANVFGEHENIVTSFAKINYISPDEVSLKTDIKVLFAKDAVSTGWDCPRAEVIYSQRSRKDPTYIAQLIGRMIRTPLARRIEEIDSLNTVSCYLPDYDENSVQKVVERLRNDVAAPTREILTNPARVRWFGSSIKNMNDSENLKRGANVPFKNLERESTVNSADESNVDVGLAKNDSFQDWQAVNPNYPQNTIKQVTASGLQSKTAPQLNGKAKEPSKVSSQMINENDANEVREVFESIVSRTVSHQQPNHFKDLFTAMDIVIMDLDPNNNLNSEFGESFYRKVESEIIIHNKEFERSLNDVTSFVVTVKRVDPLTGKTIEDKEDVVQNDLETSMLAYTNAIKKFSGAKDMSQGYVNKYADLHEGDTDKAIWRFTAVADCFEIMADLDEWADSQTSQLIDEYGPQRYAMSDEHKSEWDKVVGNIKPYVESNLYADAASLNQNKNNKAYTKHIFCDKNGYAYFQLEDLEDNVVNTEISKPLNIAWYRNPARNLKASLCIPYQLNGEWKNMYPDFIFFQKTHEGEIVPIIVDPHGDWLGDSVAKLKGYVAYLRDFSKTFGLVQAVTGEKDGPCRYLNLLDAKVQKEITSFTGDTAKSLFTGPLSHPYKLNG